MSWLSQVLESSYKWQPSRDDFAKTEKFLKGLGADVVATYDDVADDEHAKEIVGDKVRGSQSEGLPIKQFRHHSRKSACSWIVWEVRRQRIRCALRAKVHTLLCMAQWPTRTSVSHHSSSSSRIFTFAGSGGLLGSTRRLRRKGQSSSMNWFR